MKSNDNALKGIFEREPGSDTWWIRYADGTRYASGKSRIRRELAGSKSSAIKLYKLRTAAVLKGEKVPENLRKKPVTFTELSKDALEYSTAHKRSHDHDEKRMQRLVELFGANAAENIMPQDIERALTTLAAECTKGWKPATFNRYKALISLTYRLGIANGKVPANPARLVKARRENNTRTRYLLPEEEIRLRTAIVASCPERLPEFEVALHTGMRRGEQYGLMWADVNLDNRIITVPRSKNGEKRFVFLNDAAVSAFQLLWQFSKGTGKVFANGYYSAASKGAREWFEKALRDAKITDFTWHCLRHTFASRLVMAGVDIRTVQELMGHKTITVTLRYAHLAPQHQLAAVQRLCDTEAARKESTGTKTDTSSSSDAEPATARPN